MHVTDLAKACLFLLENYSNSSHINVGTGIDVSIYDFAYLIKEIVDYNGQITFDISKPDGTMLKKLDTSKINDLGWKAEIDLKTGLIETYNWALKNKVFENEY